MTINTSVSAFAQNDFSDTDIQNETNSVGNIVVTEDGVTINGTYYTKAEFTNLLDQAVEISDSKNEDTDSRVGIAAGIYFIPGIGQVAIAATGAIVVAGTVVVAGSWLYKSITKSLSSSRTRTLAKLRAKIPSRLRKEDGTVDLGKFGEKVPRSDMLKEKGGWKIDKDNGKHGGRKWKLLDKRGERVASLGENGEIVSR